MKKQYLKYLIKYFLLLFCTFSSSKEEKNNKELNIYIHGFGAGGNNNITDVSNCKLNQDKYYDEIKYFDYPDSDIFKLSRKNRTESGKKLYNLLINEEIQKIKNIYVHSYGIEVLMQFLLENQKKNQSKLIIFIYGDLPLQNGHII